MAERELTPPKPVSQTTTEPQVVVFEYDRARALPILEEGAKKIDKIIADLEEAKRIPPETWNLQFDI